MNKLSIIHNALDNNPDVLIIEHLETNHLPNPKEHGLGHEVEFWVIPIDFNSYTMTGDDLTKLRKSLIPLEPSDIDEFHHWSKDVSMLCFNEDIGTRHTRSEIVISDKVLALSDGLTDGKLVLEKTEDIQRLVRVILFPDEETVERARMNVASRQMRNAALGGL